MNEALFAVLKVIGQKEFELENIRQLLCEEIQFTPQTAFKYILKDSFCHSIDLYSLLNFLGTDRNSTALQSVLKFYSNNELRIDLCEFEAMVMARQDKLITKLTKQRYEAEGMMLPSFLVNYCKKLWMIEQQLHLYLYQFRSKGNTGLKQFLRFYKSEDNVNEELLREQYVNLSQHSCGQCPEISFQLAMRYIKRGDLKQSVTFERFVSIIELKNCNTITEYLSAQEEAFRRKNSKPKGKDPLVHKQFSKMQARTDSGHFCFREIRSVEEHLRRGGKVPDSKKMRKRISDFSENLKGQFVIFFKKVLKIVNLSQQINIVKQRLVSSFNCNFSGFFRQITNGQSLIPSELQYYLKEIGVNVELGDLFPLFKKYGDFATGKITLRHFVDMFIKFGGIAERLQSKGDRKDEFVDPHFRAALIACILNEMQLEIKIEQIKRELAEGVQIRQIFDGLNPDKKGRISSTDLQVVYRRVTGNKLEEKELNILWGRMGYKLDEYINYDVFMFQMLPRTKKRPVTSKSKASLKGGN